ncbi:MAG: DUF2892 domain-containing protein [Ignavibacteriaceae bacterium]|nr:DUF2892 domain-containing protein [Ignavibacteriaceae bacterium]
MIKNMGYLDSIIRRVLGFALISMLFWVNSDWKYLGLFGFVLIGTSCVNSCPLYLVFKWSSIKKKLSQSS